MEIKSFFEETGLYQEFIVCEDYSDGKEKFHNPIHFHKVTYEGYCEDEQSFKTFETEIDRYPTHQVNANEHSYIINEIYLKDEKIYYDFVCYGKCKSCNNYKITYTIFVYSNNPVPRDLLIFGGAPGREPKRKNFEHNTRIFAQKIGCYPQIRPKINPKITNHFSREAAKWYFKALDLMSKGYGIGAFSYFRRIIESELMNIVREIKELPDAHEQEIGKLIEEYDRHPKTSNIYNYLPNSLKVLGDNPIKLLYNQTSEGLHTLSEEECLNRSKDIAMLLEFTLLKINEEKSEIHAIKKAIKNLKSHKN